MGAVAVFVRYTSCSFIVMDNADRAARRDLEEFFERLVPEDTPSYGHMKKEVTTAPRTFARSLSRSSEVISIEGGRTPGILMPLQMGARSTGCLTSLGAFGVKSDPAAGG
jgi:thiamine phosphate synthase YjbQ (UPF0047 family)